MTRASTDRSVSPAAARRSAARGSRKSGFGGTLLGLFIGIALGLGLAAAAAWYVMKSGNPYQPATAAASRDSGKEPARTAKSEPATSDKPRFDFYKILPSGEDPKATPKPADKPVAEKAPAEKVPPEKSPAPDKAVAKLEDRPATAPPDKAAAPEKVARAPESAAPAKPAERLWLQAGSFTNEGDAENMKAQLALTGLEPNVQQATLPDKSVRYRVRLGPYASVDEMNRVKADLTKRGVDVAVIR
jgi:cell division protein FtsN